MTEMRRSWLVQRLTKPRGPSALGKDNPFAFGGGYRNGGLSDDAMDLLRPIIAFDYMGAAEFEWGAVPKALNAIAAARGKSKRSPGLIAFSFEIPLSEVKPDFGDKSKPASSGTVYVLCPVGWEGEVEARIREWAAMGYGSHLKETTMLDRVLRPVRETSWNVCGWLELDNGFMFFTDPEMWRGVCDLFGVETPVETATA